MKKPLQLAALFWFAHLGLQAGELSPAAIAIEWPQGPASGSIEVMAGKLDRLEIQRSPGSISNNQFQLAGAQAARLTLSFSEAHLAPGSGATIVRIVNPPRSFAFFLRDVSTQCPIFLPEYSVAVTLASDPRTYSQLAADIRRRGLRSKLEQIDSEPEASFASAAAQTRDQPCPTWLGVSRDMRIFELTDSRSQPSGEMNGITPRRASSSVNLPEFNNGAANYGFVAGRGQGVALHLTRRLEDGVLPILHSTLVDEDIEYHSTALVSFESSPLAAGAPMGTHFLVADAASGGHMFTPEQEALLPPLQQEEQGKTEETVLYCRVEAVNNAEVPRYAWFKNIRPGTGWWAKFKYTLDPETGFSSFAPDRVFAVAKCNGQPLRQEEMAVLLQPREKAVFEFYLPHSPISSTRAQALSRQSFDVRQAECKAFWEAKLNQAARIQVPEKRINEMVRAGLLHLDLITYGREPSGTLAPTIGVYSPIGTESSPIIQFYASLGLAGQARRSLNFFLDKQHEDGFIQNFGGYMIETGAALWSMGEYYRYTQDKEWLAQTAPKILKSCQYLQKWRARNQQETLRGRGYGMIDGKVADPEDPYHQFMLNAYGFLGLSRAAEMLAALAAPDADRWQEEAREWKQDIRVSFEATLARSPVVPLGDGTWCPTAPPWTEADGMRALYLQPERFFSHGTFTVADAMLGPLYLVFGEVYKTSEPAAEMLLKYHSELFYLHNAAFSQPYYSRHNWVQLKRGLVKPFLKTYYHTFSSVADRETYSFWEHLYHVSPHKTHEEAWFLMETRWMLYLEDGPVLNLLPGIPRRWLEDGQRIELKNVASYFGPVSLSVLSRMKTGSIEATVACPGSRKPESVRLRLPHPEGKRATRVTGGMYEPATETIRIEPFTGNATLKVEYN